MSFRGDHESRSGNGGPDIGSLAVRCTIFLALAWCWTLVIPQAYGSSSTNQIALADNADVIQQHLKEGRTPHVLIDFESDPTGAVPNGFSSDDSSITHFSDSDGADLQLGDFTPQSDGIGLVVGSDDASELVIDFDVPIAMISLWFGNDDPDWSNPGDEAVLKAFSGGAMVAEVRVVMNRNDIMDQSISFSGQCFDQATFLFDVTTGTGLIEIVDNIEIVPCEALIDFESDPTGSVPNGWTSDDSSITSFSDSVGAELNLYDAGVESDGIGMGVFSDDASELIMDFNEPIGLIRLWFGNDDPDWTNPGDEAVLSVFDGGTPVGTVRVEMNRNDVMDQSIAFGNVCFDQATFLFDVTTGTGLIEVVDNIRIVPCSVLLWYDGFESGDTTQWSNTVGYMPPN